MLLFCFVVSFRLIFRSYAYWPEPLPTLTVPFIYLTRLVTFTWASAAAAAVRGGSARVASNWPEEGSLPYLPIHCALQFCIVDDHDDEHDEAVWPQWVVGRGEAAAAGLHTHSLQLHFFIVVVVVVVVVVVNVLRGWSAQWAAGCGVWVSVGLSGLSG